MKLSPVRLATLSLAITLAVAACKPGAEAPLPGADGSASTPTTGAPAGDKVSAQITGAGATFIYPLLSKWSNDYNKATGARINYQSIASGGGIAPINAGTVHS